MRSRISSFVLLSLACAVQTEAQRPASTGQMPTRPGLFQASPVVIGDTMYVSTGYAAGAVLNAATGDGVQYIVLATGGGDSSELVAFSLDGAH